MLRMLRNMTEAQMSKAMFILINFIRNPSEAWELQPIRNKHAVYMSRVGCH